jgi:Rps23 Pro-64 3,4-dihydroxylase Tpa1-like proline 4-hydroxylase
LADPPPAADPVLAFLRRRLHRLAVEFRLGAEFESPDGSGPRLELSDVIVTAHCDADFLGPHHDDGWPGLRNGRLLSFVYWFHDQPRRFDGGELTLTGWTSSRGALRPTGPRIDLEPEHDCMVVFPSITRHELHAVSCVPDDFRSARFALVGFIRRAAARPRSPVT